MKVVVGENDNFFQPWRGDLNLCDLIAVEAGFYDAVRFLLGWSDRL